LKRCYLAVLSFNKTSLVNLVVVFMCRACGELLSIELSKEVC
jgi:hypothetical protein